MLDALRAGHVVAAAGTTLRATLDPGDGPALPGDLVVGSTGTLDVVVRSPDWIEPGTLRVWHDGTVIAERPLEPATDTVWLEEAFPIDVDADGWLVVEVEGTTPMGAAWRDERPYAITNAFRLDRTGDGWMPGR